MYGSFGGSWDATLIKAMKVISLDIKEIQDLDSQYELQVYYEGARFSEGWSDCR